MTEVWLPRIHLADVDNLGKLADHLDYAASEIEAGKKVVISPDWLREWSRYLRMIGVYEGGLDA